VVDGCPLYFLADLPMTNVLEGVVIVKKNPDAVDEED